MDRLPLLRTDIQLLPAEIQGRRVLAISDHLGLCDPKRALNPGIVQYLNLFDGSHTLRDLQMTMMRSQGNRLVMLAEAERVVKELDELFMLETRRYTERKAAVRAEFESCETRPAAMAGSAYPAQQSVLDAMLHETLSMATPGLQSRSPRVIVAPHIDLAVGRRVYAEAYSGLRGICPRRLIVLGTGHAMDDGLFSITTKSYETPIGSFPTDEEAVLKLKGAGDHVMTPDDFCHRSEHSIEFQMLFLRHLLDEDPSVVSILIGNFDEHLESADRPSEIPGVGGFLQELSAMVDENTLIVAGVDLSHVGPKFGHRDTASMQESSFREHDKRLLEALIRGSVEDFWAEGRRVKNRYHVCGFAVLACLLEVFSKPTGEILAYEVWHEAPTRSAVSFAAVTFS